MVQPAGLGLRDKPVGGVSGGKTRLWQSAFPDPICSVAPHVR